MQIGGLDSKQVGIGAAWLAGAVLVGDKFTHGGLGALVFMAVYICGTICALIATQEAGQQEAAATSLAARCKRLEALLRAQGIDPDKA